LTPGTLDGGLAQFPGARSLQLDADKPVFFLSVSPIIFGHPAKIGLYMGENQPTNG
jgi:hypothetical protein